ncbi:GNAT family N-acetyltransferase [Actinomyces sp. oral taxon 414]|uniref:GNAT family N-acetyltransferase n=1 Tax=Actinomyces sp. oral taxon 414 TaxID=712122 RepID=UPI000A56E971|nr:GNAT family N-acetyltransferase [Actinomyces sp. oral taxon 414]
MGHTVPHIATDAAPNGAAPELRAAGPDDLDAVVDLLTGVFLDDPLMSAIAAAAPDPRAALGHLHRVELAAHYLAADPAARADSRVDLAVDATSGEPLGVALWDAPSSTDVVGPLGPGSEPPPGLDLDLLGGAWELCLADAAQCEAHRPAEPHWYLYMVAVTPAARGRGIGGRLLGHGLRRVDAEGLPAHLESTTPGSRRLYERFGFRQVAELAGSGLPVYWAMTRPTRTGGPRGAESIGGPAGPTKPAGASDPTGPASPADPAGADSPGGPSGPTAPTGPVPTPR